MTTDLENLNTRDLLDEYEYTVKTFHYDPMASHNPQFTVDELRTEVERRLAEYDKLNAS
jgi:hypothetical protein